MGGKSVLLRQLRGVAQVVLEHGALPRHLDESDQGNADEEAVEVPEAHGPRLGGGFVLLLTRLVDANGH